MPEDPSQPDLPPSEHPTTDGGASARPGSGSDDDLIAAAQMAAQARSDGKIPEPDLPPPDYFPGYVVSREIHRGGQGIVYQAVHKTTKRKVAIKVMLEGALAGARERTRFEREVEILAQLDHPGIVDVLDSGSVEGKFYYVMEYISGATLDVWISQNDLSITEILDLFAKVCDGVNAAHLKGVIHRDLKPANVRVDSNGHPHIVDFGLARIATGSFDDEQQVMTLTGQFIGSLPWASPEQAQGLPSMIDVRTDVYSLGVMLYQMLTGRFPYQVAGAMRDVLDNILRAEPERPSTVRRQINDEIETIVLKCMSKERDRRYQSAGELSRDIGHYLRGEPIEAKRDSGWYVLKKAARRHRVPVAFAAIVGTLVVGSTIGLSVLYSQKSEALTDLSAESAARLEVIAELEIWFGEPDPTTGAGKDVTMREVADRAARRLEERALDAQPRVEASLRSILGSTYFSLGDLVQAELHLRRAADLQRDLMGIDDPETIATTHALGVVLRNLARLEEAEPLLLESRRRAEEVFGPTDARTVSAMNDLGQLFKLAGDDARAIEQFRATLDHAPPDTAPSVLAVVRANLGESLARVGSLEESATMLDRAVVSLREVHGDAHPHVARALQRQAVVLHAMGESEAAQRTLSESISIFGQTLDPTHQDLLATRLRLASWIEASGDAQRASEIYLEIVAAGERTLEDRSEVLAWYRHLYGRSLVTLDRAAEARPILEQAVEVLREARHRRAPDAMRTLLLCYEALDDDEAAEAIRAQLDG